jgi:hypothetical protein
MQSNVSSSYEKLQETFIFMGIVSIEFNSRLYYESWDNTSGNRKSIEIKGSFGCNTREIVVSVYL